MSEYLHNRNNVIEQQNVTMTRKAVVTRKIVGREVKEVGYHMIRK